MFVAAMPDHFETFRPKLDNPNAPTMPGKQPGTFEANERYKDAPGAMLRPGNMPATVQYGVHAADDVILTASGPGSDRVHGQMENTEVFRVIADALGLGEGAAPSRAALP
jgi:alkaline phosphatase